MTLVILFLVPNSKKGFPGNYILLFIEPEARTKYSLYVYLVEKEEEEEYNL